MNIQINSPATVNIAHQEEPIEAEEFSMILKPTKIHSETWSK